MSMIRCACAPKESGCPCSCHMDYPRHWINGGWMDAAKMEHLLAEKDAQIAALMLERGDALSDRRLHICAWCSHLSDDFDGANAHSKVCRDNPTTARFDRLQKAAREYMEHVDGSNHVSGYDMSQHGYEHQEIAVYSERAAALRNETYQNGCDEVIARKVHIIVDEPPTKKRSSKR